MSEQGLLSGVGGLFGGGIATNSAATSPTESNATFGGPSITNGTSAVIANAVKNLPAWAIVLSLVTLASVVVLGISKPRKNGSKKTQPRKRKATN